jgi:hypothetical protein
LELDDGGADVLSSGLSVSGDRCEELSADASATGG